MIRAVIADDEALARELLRSLLASHEDIEIVGEAASGPEAINLCQAHLADLVFLDVDMPPGRDGIDTAVAILEQCACEIVMVTAHERYAIDAFDVGVTDYVLKPIRRTRLALALMRARARRAARQVMIPSEPIEEPAGGQGQLWIRTRTGTVRVQMNEVAWIEAARDHVFLHTSERAYMHRATMEEIERSFAGADLVRVHRSAFVRLSRVEQIRRHQTSLTLDLDNGMSVPVGASYRAVVSRLLKSGEP